MPAAVRIVGRPPATLAAMATAVLLGACTSTPTGTSTPPSTDSATTVTTSNWSANCPLLEHPAIQLGGHLVGDNPPPQAYSSVPPTSGWHARTVPEPGIEHVDLDDPAIAAALEAGIVVVATAPDVDTTDLDAVLAQFPDRLLATTYTADMPSPVALLTWGTVARCDTVAATDITTFVLTERVIPEGHQG